MQTATEALARVEREAVEKKVAETRYVKSMAVGRVARQGDIYLHRVEATHLHGRKLDERQLAVGVTQGSRHVVEGPTHVFEGTALPPLVVEWCRQHNVPPPPLGPCVTSKKRLLITHPEHAHLDLPAGTYQVTHQRDERTGGRVQD